MSVSDAEPPPVPASSEESVTGPSFNEHGVPDHLRSIHVTTGGGWYINGSEGVIYGGGEEMYIHYVNPKKFTVKTLFMAIKRMKVEFYLPGHLWFRKSGLNFPECLHPIGSNEDLAAMWEDCEQNNSLEGHIFTQAVDKIRNRAVLGLMYSYLIPLEVPRLPPTVDIRGIHMAALEGLYWERKNIRSGLKAWAEVMGKRYYVSPSSTPRPVFTSSRRGQVAPLRGYCRPCEATMKRGFVIDVVNSPRHWRNRLGLDPPEQINLVDDETRSRGTRWRNCIPKNN